MRKVPVAATAFAGLTAIGRAPLLLVGALLVQTVAVAASAAISIATPEQTAAGIAAPGVELLIGLATYSLVAAGAIRVFVRPARKGVLGLALGLDELRLFGLHLLMAVVAGLIMFLGLLLIGLLVGRNVEAVTSGVIALLCTVLAALVLIVLCGRFSPAAAKCIADRRLRLASAWKLTRGQTLRLPGAFALVALVSAIAFLLSNVGFVALAESIGANSDLEQLWWERPRSLQAFLAPSQTLYQLFNIPLMALLYLLWSGPGGVAYAALAGETAEDQAAVFA